MALLKKYKMHVLLAALAILIVIVWLNFSGPSAPQPLLTSEQATESAVEQGLVQTLLQLRSVSLNGTIFSDPAFVFLRDFGTQIVPEPVGRQNPFAPISARATTTKGNALFSR